MCCGLLVKLAFVVALRVGLFFGGCAVVVAACFLWVVGLVRRLFTVGLEFVVSFMCCGLGLLVWFRCFGQLLLYVSCSDWFAGTCALGLLLIG